MARWRDVELEGLLGGPLDASGLTEQALKRLVAGEAREGERLEFKAFKGERPYQDHPGARPTWTEAQEFAKDVCALANLRGGLLLIGVEEDGEMATGLEPITAEDPGALTQRLRQALRNQAAPLPLIEVLTFPAFTGGSYAAVIVPPSPSAPHAVIGRPGDGGRRPLHYPIRDGADVRYMTEGDVAAAYRRRSEGQLARAARVRNVLDDGLTALRRAQGLWLYACVVPEVGAEGQLDRATTRDAHDWWQHNGLASPFNHVLLADGPAIPAPGRVTFSGRPSRDDEEVADPRHGYLELHVNGASFAGSPVGSRTREDPKFGEVGDVTLAEAVLLALDACLSWATRQAGAWGTAQVILGLKEADSEQLRAPLVLVGTRYLSLTRISDRRLLEAPQATTLVDLAATDDGPRRMVAVHDGLAALLQHFGVVGPTQFGADGAIITGTWNVQASHVQAWAENWGLLFRQEPDRA